jgi:hypothetical protein
VATVLRALRRTDPILIVVATVLTFVMLATDPSETPDPD